MENAPIPSPKPYINSYACRLVEPYNFCSRNNYFWNVPISNIIQNQWKKLSSKTLFGFKLTIEHIQLYEFHPFKLPTLPSYIQGSSSKSISVRNVRGSIHICFARQSTNIAIFTRNNLCWSLFLMGLQSWTPANSTNLLKRDFSAGVFLWISQKF